MNANDAARRKIILSGIQLGTVEAPEGWIRKIC